MPTAKLNRRSIAAIKPEAKPVIWFDADLKGFGLKVQPTGARSWVVEYRPGAGGRSVNKKRMVIGSTGALSPERAREEAQRILANVELGGDPAGARTAERAEMTLAKLCDRYLEEGCALKKASTLATDRGRIKRHIKPLLGNRRVGSITSADIDKLMRDVAAGKIPGKHVDAKGRPIALGGKGTATRTVRLLGGIFSWAIKQKIRSDNPVVGVEKFPDQRGERYLSSDEMRRLGNAIHEAETIGIEWKPTTSKYAPKGDRRTVIDAHAVAAIRLLIFTGCRLGEILNLTWREVDLERGILLLADSKTGRKSVVLSGPAMTVLYEIKRAGAYVIAGEKAGTKDEKPRSDLKRPWAMIRERARLSDVRLHDLRHSYASVGAGSGMGLPIIGKLLGHANAATTERYAHLDVDPVRMAANSIASKIAKAMGHNGEG